jgi:hypothetical protein
VSYPRRKITGRGLAIFIAYKTLKSMARQRGILLKYPVLFLECGHYTDVHGYVPKNWTIAMIVTLRKVLGYYTGGTYIKRQVMRTYQGRKLKNLLEVGEYTEFAVYVTDFKIMWE